MDPVLVSMLALRGLSTLFTLQGKSEIGNTINQVLDLYGAGKNVDAHMKAIAEKLEAGDDLDDWSDIQAKLDAEVDDFLGD
jgi:RecB family exonuclease